MSTDIVVFLAIGIIGTVLVALSLLLGDIFDFTDGGGPFSTPAIAGFMGAFGYTGAITASIADENTAMLGALAGLIVAIPSAWAISALVDFMARQTDKTLVATDYVGAHGVVITTISKKGYGEVSLAVAGQPLKLAARAETELPAGTPIIVVQAPSETLVFVKRSEPSTLKDAQ